VPTVPEFLEQIVDYRRLDNRPTVRIDMNFCSDHGL
jgi:hypothetical protein